MCVRGSCEKDEERHSTPADRRRPILYHELVEETPRGEMFRKRCTSLPSPSFNPIPKSIQTRPYFAPIAVATEMTAY